MMHHKIAIFDLDNTLIDTDQRFFNVIKQCISWLENRTGDIFQHSAEKILRQKPWISINTFIDQLLSGKQYKQQVKIEFIRQYYQAPFTQQDALHCKLFPYTSQVLHFLRKRGFFIVLITFGNPRVQKEKIKQIGAALFDFIHVVPQGSKESVIRSLVHKWRTDPSLSFVIGDKRNDEIAAGNHLGFQTIHYCFGRYRNTPIMRTIEKPSFIVYNMKDLLGLFIGML